MMGIRDKAKEALDTYTQKAAQMLLPSFISPDASLHIFGVHCQNCGQVTYFDKRRVCTAKRPILRGLKTVAGKELDMMELQCKQCQQKWLVQIDCEGYL